MSTLLTRMFRTDPARPRVCTGCMVGQGRQCACRAKRKRRELSPTEATWLVIVADVVVLLLVAALVRGVIS